MLEILIKKGYIDYERLLMDYSKALGLSAEEVVVLLKLLKEYLKTDDLVVENLPNELLMTSYKIDKTVANLMERGYYEVYIVYDQGVGKEKVSFKPLFQRIESLLKEEQTFDPYSIQEANRLLTQKLNRVLTSSELDILQSLMIEDHYTFDQIQTAVEDIKRKNKVLSMRSLTQTLADKKAQIAPQKEAPASLKEFYNKI